MNQPLTHGDSQITVGRWRGTYIVPADHPSPQELQDRLDKIVLGRLTADCSAYLEQYIDATDPAVWRIRKLMVKFSVEERLSGSDEVARDWGRRIASDICSVVEQAEQSESVLCFPNRVAFLSQFIFDLAEGRAWEKWYYEEFEELRILSNSRVICSALDRWGLPSSDVILDLAAGGRLETVLRTLNDGDARLIYEACFDGASRVNRDDGLEKWTGSVLELWNESPLRAASRDENRFRDALRLYGRVVRRFPAGKRDPQLKVVIDGLLELRRVFSAIRSASRIDAIIRELARGDCWNAAGLAHAAGASDANGALAFFAERMHGDADWCTQAVAVILGGAQQSFLTPKTLSDGECFLSSFGGIFLLGPSFQALGLAELTSLAVALTDAQEKTAAILRHVTALKCFGRPRVTEAEDDPALRLFSGFEDSAFRPALERVDARALNLTAVAEMLLHTLLDPEFGHQPCLFAEVVSSSGAGDVFVLRDLAGDEWLDAAHVSGDEAEVLSIVRASLKRLAHIRGGQCESLLLGESLSSRMNSSDLSNIANAMTVLNVNDAALLDELAVQLRLTRDQLVMRISSCERQLSYLSLANVWPDFAPDPALDCLFSLVARAALKHFARQLSGFDSSSPEHLYQNFLAGVSGIRWIDGCLEVRLPSSPLSMILRMAGLLEQEYAPAWLKGAEVWLLPQQE